MKQYRPGPDSSQAPLSGVAAVDAYLADVPEPARTTLGKVRAAILAAAPAEATERISYRIPTIDYKGPLLGYAAFTNHCSLFVMDPPVIEHFAAELASYQTSKGTIQFPSGKPLPAALLRKIVKLRVERNEARKRR